MRLTVVVKKAPESWLDDNIGEQTMQVDVEKHRISGESRVGPTAQLICLRSLLFDGNASLVSS